MTAKGYPGMPHTSAIRRALSVKRSVMTAAAGLPARSAEIASCKLHDEQLPQSPTAETTASHAVSSARIAAGAGALMFGFRRRTVARTP